MDLDLWDCFGRKKLCFIIEEIQYIYSHQFETAKLTKEEMNLEPKYKSKHSDNIRPGLVKTQVSYDMSQEVR